ncbi:transposase, partial [Microcoleus sp. B5-D4]|uniref:transposase n=1 Tax=unclassified Microcoleus TaxID=2642155 RepID=UPI002FD495CB
RRIFSEKDSRTNMILCQLNLDAFTLVYRLSVLLLFQPAYSPEVNPIERLWGYIKEQLKWLRFEQIEELRAAVQKELKKLTNEFIASLTGWQFILDAIFVAGL